jgi:hypothetical protein
LSTHLLTCHFLQVVAHRGCPKQVGGIVRIGLRKHKIRRSRERIKASGRAQLNHLIGGSQFGTTVLLCDRVTILGSKGRYDSVVLEPILIRKRQLKLSRSRIENHTRHRFRCGNRKIRSSQRAIDGIATQHILPRDSLRATWDVSRVGRR